MGLEVQGAALGRGNAVGEAAQEKKKGRLLIVGMLTTECRELLTWTLAKVAQAGDKVLAIHVAVSPSGDVSKADLEVHKFQLATKFCNVLTVYEGLCSLKQVDLQVRIVTGTKVRKALVEEVGLHDGCMLVLGMSKLSLSPLGNTTSLGKYCVKRLPPSWLVLVVEKGRVIFNKQGTQFRPSAATGNRSGTQKAGVMTSLQRGFSKKVSSRRLIAPAAATPEEGRIYQSPSLAREQMDGSPESDASSSGVVTTFSYGSAGSFSGSSMSGSTHSLDGPHSPVSVLPSPGRQRQRSFDAFRLSLSKKRADASLLSGASNNAFQERAAATHNAACAPRPGMESSAEESAGRATQVQETDEAWTASQIDTSVDQKRFCFSPCDDRALCPPVTSQDEERREEDDEFHVGWPLQHRNISSSRTWTTPQEAARSLSVVRWALQLPSRPRGRPLPCKYFDLQSLSEKLERLEPARLSTSALPAANHSMTGIGVAHGCRSLGDSGTMLSRASDPTAHFRNKSSWCWSLAQSLELLCIDKKCRFFTPEELKVATDNFSEGNLVGKGGCSRVFKGVLLDGLEVAVKSLFQERAEAVQELLTEIEIISSLQHPRIVALIGYCVDEENLILVYNFVAGGNLEENLHGHKGTAVLEWSARHKIAVGTATALEYLHDGSSRRVFHRDVKASNILLSADFEPQVSDFGLAKWAPDDASHITCSDVVGTFGYLAPEYFLCGKVDEKTDVYSFGVVLLELITGNQPIDSSRPKGQENLVSWATPLLENVAVDQLVDPRLEGRYDTKELSQMVFAASLCIRKTAEYRPKMSRILKILSGETDDLKVWLKKEPAALPEIEDDFSVPNQGKSDVRTYMALAMLGVDDNEDAISEDLAHTNKSLVEYMNGRYSRSCSFD